MGGVWEGRGRAELSPSQKLKERPETCGVKVEEKNAGKGAYRGSTTTKREKRIITDIGTGKGILQTSVSQDKESWGGSEGGRTRESRILNKEEGALEKGCDFW